MGTCRTYLVHTHLNGHKKVNQAPRRVIFYLLCMFLVPFLLLNLVKVLHYRSREILILVLYNSKFDFNKSVMQPKDHIDHQKKINQSRSWRNSSEYQNFWNFCDNLLPQPLVQLAPKLAWLFLIILSSAAVLPFFDIMRGWGITQGTLK